MFLRHLSPIGRPVHVEKWNRLILSSCHKTPRCQNLERLIKDASCDTLRNIVQGLGKRNNIVFHEQKPGARILLLEGSVWPELERDKQLHGSVCLETARGPARPRNSDGTRRSFTEKTQNPMLRCISLFVARLV